MQLQDRISEGWQVWLTPRQTRIIRDALAVYTAREGEEQHQDTVAFWPGLTRRGTRIVLDALMEFETVIDADVSELFRLRSVLSQQAQE